MYPFFKYNLIVLLLLFPILIFGNSNLYISPQYSYKVFDSHLRYSESHGYGLSLHYKISNLLTSGASISFSTPRQSFDTIGGQSYFNINTSSYKLNIIFTPIKLYNKISMNFSAGFGIINLKPDPINIDLGALGNRIIKAKSSSHLLYSFGLPVETNITSGIKIFIHPEIIYFNTDSNINQNYNFGGGFSFDLL